MPTYSFKNNDTGAEWEEFFSIADKEDFLKENDHITQLPSLITIVSDTGGIRNDGGWKDNMSRIAEAHPNSPMAQTYGTSRNHKEIKTYNAITKHAKSIV